MLQFFCKKGTNELNLKKSNLLIDILVYPNYDMKLYNFRSIIAVNTHLFFADQGLFYILQVSIIALALKMARLN